jgi:uncharacterized membrane protein required for colicin V production
MDWCFAIFFVDFLVGFFLLVSITPSIIHFSGACSMERILGFESWAFFFSFFGGGGGC